ncbi:MAG: hypothetical protein AVO33_03850 [delta proteobacterium ML8_F1]|nr:MAG: hypothetical protein AVO33_03850 [delta proteobacterium ML8_F1]
MISIRTMKNEEAVVIQKLGKQLFEPFDAMMISKPKNCIVALENEEIVGAVIYKYLTLKPVKLLYVEFIFVRGNTISRGIGRKLLDACMAQGINENCNGFSAIIRDDNVASWKLFLDRGFERVQFKPLISLFGIKETMKQLFETHFGFATGMDYYVKIDKPFVKDSITPTSFQLGHYFLVSSLVIIPLLVKDISYGFQMILALITTLLIRMLGGYLLTRFTKEEWSFRVSEGGYLIPLIASLFGGVYFLCGNWYPKVYSKSETFKQTLGLASLGQWLSLYMVILLNAFVFQQSDFLNLVTFLASFLMVLSLIPFNPVASFGGKRLYDWNKVTYGFVVVLSIVTLFII